MIKRLGLLVGGAVVCWALLTYPASLLWGDPAVNFLLAILIFTAFFSLIGTPRTNIVGDIVPRSGAAAAGIARLSAASTVMLAVL